MRAGKPRELSRHFLGAALMGVGGVFAMGCTIGQGISVAFTLAILAPIVFISIAVGARFDLAWLIEGSVRSLIPGLGHRHPAE
ncbi:YeeE/YedE thiosulfate transporter family protein [Breoghania sp.]|uniref:YeeE/YedE thiosulfate transporter family protein n=1 Tax=Breoghania sp. TaxID=2065378 RepID=UPI002635E853|nr:YeeE/YedE thiosulfate transporter family protein [Breoghania sp.]MDJ0930485.1 YeeE/YedE thiosulfate transporter family protein [Breoghania sp.]